MFKPRKTVGEMVQEARSRIENVTVAELRAELEGGGVQLLDIRDVRERQRLGWIPGSLHVPRGMLEFWLDPTSPYYAGKVDPEKRIIVYCAGGGRSALATDVLREMGLRDGLQRLESGRPSRGGRRGGRARGPVAEALARHSRPLTVPDAHPRGRSSA
jgi:rhodanese-related sulfurtransferase